MSQTPKNTLFFTHEEGQNIIVKDTLFNMDTEIAPGQQSSSYTDLKKLLEKEKKLELHAITLSDYWREGIIPRGLRMNKFPSFGKDNPVFKQKWESILNKCSFDLMLLLIDEAKIQREEIRKQIPEVQQQLAQANATATPEQKERAEVIKKKIEDEINTLTRTLTRTKMDKFRRDRQDYSDGAVYSWQRRSTRAPPKRSRTVSFTLPSSATTSEDEDPGQQTSTDRFLDHALDTTTLNPPRARRDGADGGGRPRQLRPRRQQQQQQRTMTRQR